MTNETQDVVTASGTSAVGQGGGGVDDCRLTLATHAVLACHTGSPIPIVVSPNGAGGGTHRDARDAALVSIKTSSPTLKSVH